MRMLERRRPRADAAVRAPGRAEAGAAPSGAATADGRAGERHLLVTNDFPPKVGGIQNYLWELWRRLDPDASWCSPPRSDPGAAAFDAAAGRAGHPHRARARAHPLLPDARRAGRRMRRLCRRDRASTWSCSTRRSRSGCSVPGSACPTASILHGAEVTVPGRLPARAPALGHVLRGASVVVSAGGYPAAEAAPRRAGHAAPVVEIPPGVDAGRFVPLEAAERRSARPPARPARPRARSSSSVSRLVPRKGMDVLIEAAGRLAPLLSRPGGGHRRATAATRGRLRAAGRRSPARRCALLGRVSDEDQAALLGAADVFVMACRNRWVGLEQEGFGIVFLEAAAAGVPQVAGDSGGAAEAVARRGDRAWWSSDPEDPGAVAAGPAQPAGGPEPPAPDGPGGPAPGRGILRLRRARS